MGVEVGNAEVVEAGAAAPEPEAAAGEEVREAGAFPRVRRASLSSYSLLTTVYCEMALKRSG